MTIESSWIYPAENGGSFHRFLYVYQVGCIGTAGEAQGPQGPSRILPMFGAVGAPQDPYFCGGAQGNRNDIPKNL